MPPDTPPAFADVPTAPRQPDSSLSIHAAHTRRPPRSPPRTAYVAGTPPCPAYLPATLIQQTLQAQACNVGPTNP